ncbi:hypothetical protein PtrSN002B_001132 [Pyrenophora tritici-repentis]|uniref:Uncharacterized protein n=1 Tax=Pyrenophora tritici-repentis TaxID=45151 RepID=A0A2W1F0R4_9PLEO|nr:hypothetical protein PtrV1_03017 [Pyrenophora tritici-repentis]KAF7442637.1 hypothetical protein A1F99_135060 [Pyrenophora tritici-repentis]KAF7578987.1 hypothetical protein PtrM4_032270 [Pyrenophora tritici-repentis]KAG9377921.1 hypothetical protein A1F94_011037 [Pyrenophora tritici-repentis]KAI0587264.1 hypothetical protein Alg215_01511 [Pyrenophora tritici-repentis]
MSPFAGVKQLPFIGHDQFYALAISTPMCWAGFAPEGTRPSSMDPPNLFGFHYPLLCPRKAKPRGTGEYNVLPDD